MRTGWRTSEYVSGEKGMFGVYLWKEFLATDLEPFLGFIECAVWLRPEWL